jgi:hypothetical protein
MYSSLMDKEKELERLVSCLKEALNTPSQDQQRKSILISASDLYS